MSVSLEGSLPNVRRPPAVPGTAFVHACRYLDSRDAPTPHLRTPHEGTARTHPHPAYTQKVPGNKVFRIWQAALLDDGLTLHGQRLLRTTAWCKGLGEEMHDPASGSRKLEQAGGHYLGS